MLNNKEKLELELKLLFDALHQCYGYDFSNYSHDSALRRVQAQVRYEKLSSISELIHLVIHNENFADALLRKLSINVTEMFRDPPFYLMLREKIKPYITEHQHFKIWHAGCSSGEEVYSMAIMLTEENLYNSCQLYATDFNNVILDKASSGIYKPDKMQTNSKNYQAAGGRQSFVDYYHSNYNNVIMNSTLKKNIRFSHHDLAKDGVFGEMQMIICRNVLIYFDCELQKKVFKLFTDSLCEGGFLCLGSHETLNQAEDIDRFETISETHRIYRKIR